jgi:hypothetical protein
MSIPSFEAGAEMIAEIVTPRKDGYSAHSLMVELFERCIR